MWTRTIITYTDNTTSTSYSVGATPEGIQVGGRNLAQKTSSKYDAGFSKFDGNDNVCFSIGNTLTDGLSVGDVISIKLICKYTNIVSVSGKTPQVRIVGAGNVTGWNDNGYFPVNNYTKLSGSNGEVTIMYQAIINANHVKNSYWNTLLRTDAIQSGIIQCKMFKVERGTKCTDWSPAPEDTDNKISDVWQGVNDVYDDYSEFKENTYTKADMDTKLTETKEAVLIAANAIYQRQDAMGDYYTVTQANSAIDARANQIEAKVSAIKIGGRNLIIRTGELVNKALGADGNTNDYDKTNVMGSKISVVPGEELTFHKDNGSEWFRWNWYDSEGKFMSRMPNQNNLFTWKVPDGAYFILVSYPNTGNVKVERGNRATDWTLAPEDTDAKIDDISIGGRNLIKTTDLIVGWIDDTGALRYAGDWDKTFLTGEYISVDAGKEYMFQLFWTDDNTEAWIVYAYYNANKEFIKVAPNQIYNTDKYYKEKIIIPSGVAYMRISWEFGAQRAVKLEKGNKATDWTAAPEDTEAKIALKVDEKSLKSAIEAIADTINITARGGLNISGNRFTLTSTNTTITADGTITSRGTGVGSDGNKYLMAATLRGGELKVWNNTSNNGVRIQGHGLFGYDDDGTNTIQLIYTPSDENDLSTGLWLYSNLGQEIHVTRKEIWLQGNNSDGSIYGYCNIGKGYMRIDSSGTTYYGDCALSVLGGAKIQDLHAMDSMTVGCDVEEVKMWNTYFGYCQPVTAATNRVTLKWTGAALQVWIDNTLVGTLFE